MGPSVRIEIDVPGLADALAARGIAVADQGVALLTDRVASWPGPVVVLVSDSADVAAALDAGAADAIAAGAGADEIAARIAARLRLAAPPIGIGELIIDRIARRVTRAGQRLTLHPREFDLLLHLAHHAGQTVPRSALLEAVWGLRFDPGTNVVAVHVSRLRAKLDRGFAQAMLHTEKGIGYRLAPA
ncbi:winged helix-turn-helix domain-containing protein [Sphingomonas donggukensis]|uniref:Winged helix-turn-helix domain-containing protein n=1 Tax=Sphingomonas donggukensis TaxID=2949093 RepID=A0ABY4TTJ4_9SPHN|nr:winged helix-turn-helix domain-containing protein [Sphingomonas donggukensis]URW75648.1 winged helix-turn-helix domain-containing protein [Sphingomonas donggukensis]